MLKRTSGLLGVMLVATTLTSTGASAAYDDGSGCLANGVCYRPHLVFAGATTDCANPEHGTRDSPNLREVDLSGAPRVRGVYVATKYNVRIISGSYTYEQFSVDREPLYEACFLASNRYTVALQGCRYRVQWGRSYCTAWSQFTINY